MVLNKSSLSLLPTDTNEIINAVSQMLAKTSAGHDHLSMQLMKLAMPFVAQPLADIINKSFIEGVFPDELKIAKVCPMFKSGDQCHISNYRPISILPSFSKVFERLMYNRLLSFLDKNNVLFRNQFGFRANHSTSMAVIEMVDRISAAIEEKKFSIGIFIDLSKAFDTVNHSILLDKLEHYGIRGIALEWFKSYLSNRKQFVEYNNSKSSLKEITCGVPQGSILGPLLFLLYVNDISNVSKILHFILFADDTNIFLSDQNVDSLISIANNELCKLTKWFLANRLTVNVTKSNFIFFRSQKAKSTPTCSNLMLNGKTLLQVNSAKFLGIYIDEHLNWKKHTTELQMKISKNCGILSKLKHHLSAKLLLLLYNSLILPYLNYCVCIWAETSLVNIKPIIKLQKRCIRIVAQAGFKSHSDPLFKKFSVLKVTDLHIMQVAHLMYKNARHKLPSTFESYFMLSNEVHHHYTRSSTKYFVPYCRTVGRSHSFKLSGPRVWNSLPPDVIAAESESILKKRLKKYLLEMYTNN